jgi:hypothetical protein
LLKVYVSCIMVILTRGCERTELLVANLFPLIEYLWLFDLFIEWPAITGSVRLYIPLVLLDNPILVRIIVFDRTSVVDEPEN